MTGGGLGALTGLGYGDPDGSRRGEMNEKRRALCPYQFFGAPWTANGTGQNAAHSGGYLRCVPGKANYTALG